MDALEKETLVFTKSKLPNLILKLCSHIRGFG
jgi:hypothetical protein